MEGLSHGESEALEISDVTEMLEALESQKLYVNEAQVEAMTSEELGKFNDKFGWKFTFESTAPDAELVLMEGNDADRVALEINTFFGAESPEDYSGPEHRVDGDPMSHFIA